MGGERGEVVKLRVVGGMVWEVGGWPVDGGWVDAEVGGWRVVDVRAQRGWVRGRARAPERARGGGIDGERFGGGVVGFRGWG